MIFLQPNALLILLWLVPLILILHFIRTRYQRQRVSSVLLWRKVRKDLQAYATWRRPLWDPLLLLQLLATVLGALALARPSLPAGDAGHLAIVLDGSASMRATDVSPSRFDAARRLAQEMIDRLGPSDVASVVLAGPRPQLLASDRHRGTLSAAMQVARPADEPADMESALVLAASLAATQPGKRTEVVAITDGTFDLDLAALPTSARFVRVGSSAENRAITEVSVRRSPRGEGAMAGYARVTNAAASAAEVRLQVLADGLSVHTRGLTLAPSSSSEVSFTVPEGTRRVSLLLTPQDVLTSDDRVDIPAPLSRSRRVLVVSDSPAIWERVLKALPEITFQAITPAMYLTPPTDAVLLLDGFLPNPLPTNDLILVNPPPSSRPVPVAGDVRNARVRDFDPKDPLLNGIDFSPVAASRGSIVALPAWASSAADADHGPMLLHGRWDNRRVVVFAFDVHASNLPQLAAFPVLMANTINWLTPNREDETRGGLKGEADIRPRTHEPIPAIQEPKGAPLPERELWPFVAGLVLVVLAGEWWLFARRG